jgi:hypothetical protein
MWRIVVKPFSHAPQHQVESRKAKVEKAELDSLLSDYFHQHSLAPSAVEFAVENLFPRAEVQFAFGDCNDDFPAHDLTLEVGVGIVFASAIVAISGSRLMRREFFQPDLIIVMESRFIVINKHRGGDVHGVDETKAFGHAAPVNQFLDLRRDVDETAPIRHLEPKMFSQRFQSSSPKIKCKSGSDNRITKRGARFCCDP